MANDGIAKTEAEAVSQGYERIPDLITHLRNLNAQMQLQGFVINNFGLTLGRQPDGQSCINKHEGDICFQSQCLPPPYRYQIITYCGPDHDCRRSYKRPCTP
jgi:hypothetical protein